MKIEEHERGYPQLAAFAASDPSFAIVRKFTYLYARNLLFRQDRLADIESRLQKLDAEEEVQGYLSSRRYDKNDSRMSLLSGLGGELGEYGNRKGRSSYLYMLSLPKPSPMAKQSVRNWMDHVKPLVESEARFLSHENDLVSMDAAEDRTQFDEAVALMADKFLPYDIGYRLLSSTTTRALTSDKNVRLYTPGRVQNLSRIVITLIVVVLLLATIAALYSIHTSFGRFLAIVFSVLVFALIACLTTTAKKIEILAATAAYGAVLVVFVARLV